MLDDIARYKTPVSYYHPQGAIEWVKLDESTSAGAAEAEDFDCECQSSSSAKSSSSSSSGGDGGEEYSGERNAAVLADFLTASARCDYVYLRLTLHSTRRMHLFDSSSFSPPPRPSTSPSDSPSPSHYPPPSHSPTPSRS